MATLRRSASVDASPDAVWELISDAYALPRWWPRVARVEGVTETGFTAVLYSRRGRPVRLDLSYTEVREEHVLAWQLDVVGGPFERLLHEWHTRLILAPDSDRTQVTIEERQSFRGSFRTGGLLQRRAQRKRLTGALAGLAQLF